MKDLTQRDPRTYKIIGAAMEVHRQLGCGFLEPVYQEAFALELKSRELPYSRELKFPVSYKGQRLHNHYRLNFGGPPSPSTPKTQPDRNSSD